MYSITLFDHSDVSETDSGSFGWCTEREVSAGGTGLWTRRETGKMYRDIAVNALKCCIRSDTRLYCLLFLLWRRTPLPPRGLKVNYLCPVSSNQEQKYNEGLREDRVAQQTPSFPLHLRDVTNCRYALYMRYYFNTRVTSFVLDYSKMEVTSWK